MKKSKIHYQMYRDIYGTYICICRKRRAAKFSTTIVKRVTCLNCLNRLINLGLDAYDAKLSLTRIM